MSGKPSLQIGREHNHPGSGSVGIGIENVGVPPIQDVGAFKSPTPTIKYSPTPNRLKRKLSSTPAASKNTQPKPRSNRGGTAGNRAGGKNHGYMKPIKIGTPFKGPRIGKGK